MTYCRFTEGINDKFSPFTLQFLEISKTMENDNIKLDLSISIVNINGNKLENKIVDIDSYLYKYGREF